MDTLLACLAWPFWRSAIAAVREAASQTGRLVVVVWWKGLLIARDSRVWVNGW